MTTTGTAAARPTSLREAHEAMSQAHHAGQVVRLRGAGTAEWGAPAAPADVVVDARGMDALLVHNPSDMTVAVQAGMPLRALQDLLAPTGQWLATAPAPVPRGAARGGERARAHAGRPAAADDR